MLSVITPGGCQSEVVGTPILHSGGNEFESLSGDSYLMRFEILPAVMSSSSENFVPMYQPYDGVIPEGHNLNELFHELPLLFHINLWIISQTSACQKPIKLDWNMCIKISRAIENG